MSTRRGMVLGTLMISIMCGCPHSETRPRSYDFSDDPLEPLPNPIEYPPPPRHDNRPAASVNLAEFAEALHNLNMQSAQRAFRLDEDNDYPATREAWYRFDAKPNEVPPADDPLMCKGSARLCELAKARDCSGSTLLHIAVARGDLIGVNQLLFHVPQLVLAKDGLGRTPLLVAIGAAQQAIAERLLIVQGIGLDWSAHTDADGRGPWHHLALMAARSDMPARKRSQVAASLALSLRVGKAPIDLPDGQGYTPLMTAIRVGAIEVFETLLKAGATRQMAARQLQPLHVLARHADRFASAASVMVVLKQLAPADADFAALSPSGLTPLGEAIVAGHRAAASLAPALSGASPSPGPAAAGLSPVRLALLSGRIDIAKALVAAGHPTDIAWLAATTTGRDLDLGATEACGQVGPDGLGCIHIAAMHGNLSFMQSVAERAPALLAQTTATTPALAGIAPVGPGSSFLHVAVAFGRSDIVRWAGTIDTLASRQQLQRIVSARNAAGMKPADMTSWRVESAAMRLKSRRVDDLAQSVAVEKTSMLGHGSGTGSGFGVGGAVGDKYNRNQGVSPDDLNEHDPTAPEGVGVEPNEGSTVRPLSFQVLGFGGSSQVREYPVEEDFFGQRLASAPVLFQAPLTTFEHNGLELRRERVRACIAEGQWLAVERLTSEYLGHVDAADPFRAAWAAEALHLRFRALTGGNDVAAAVLKAARELGAGLSAWLQGALDAANLHGNESGRVGDPAADLRATNAPVPRSLIGVLAAQGAERLDRGDIATAYELLAVARSYLNPLQPIATAHLLGTLGRLQTAESRYDLALKSFAAAGRLRRNLGDLGSGPVVSNLINRGVVEELLGRLADAKETWGDALEETVGCVECPQGLFATLLTHNLARIAFAENDFGYARALNTAAHRTAMLPGAGPAWLRGRIALTDGDIIVTEIEADGDSLADFPDDKAKALARFEDARKLLISAHGKTHPLIGRALWRIAELVDDPNDRRERYTEAWVMTARSAEERWPLAYAWSRFEEEAGRLDVAAFLARAAVISLQQVRRSVRVLGDETESAWLDARLEAYRHATRLALKVGRSGDATTIIGLQEIESHLAFTRSETWSGRTPQLPLDNAERRAIGSPAVATAVPRVGVDQAEDPAGFRERVTDVKAFLKDLDRRRPSAHAARGTLSHQSEQARALQSTLRRVGDSTVWMHLVPTDTDITAIITTPKRQFTRTHPLPDVDLARIVQRFKESLLQRKPGIEAASEQLYTAIFAPFRNDLGGAGIVYIAADGMLRDIPFAALHDGADWLGASFAFVSASFLTLSRLERSPPPLDDWRVEAFGVSKASHDFSALPGVPEELAGIIASRGSAPASRNAAPAGLPGRVRLDADFKPETLFETLRDDAPPIVLIASHFKLGQDEEDSFLVTGNGGRLTVACMNDCDTKCLAACTEPGSSFSFQDVHLVVLSACNTAQQTAGSGRSGDRESASSLVDIAAILGADAVVGTLWPVADPSTAAFMQGFFKQMQALGGRDKAIAMQRTAQGLARGEVGDGKWKHPYFWAPFVMLGNAR